MNEVELETKDRSIDRSVNRKPKMDKKKKKENHHHQWLQWLSLVISEPFYLYHFLILFSYLVLRSSATQTFTPNFADRLLHREIQAFLALSVLMAIKVVKEETWEAFVADALFFGKGFLIVVTLLMDYQLALCYMVVFLVVFILTQQPPFHELGTSCRLTPLQLEVLLTEGSTSRFWLVEFRALYSSNCIRTSRFFPELSITYSNKNLSFGIVDLGLFPNAAEKYGISLGVSMGQLPTYILFENGVEISRLPALEFETRSHSPITKKLLCQHFELDRHLIEYIHIK